MKKIILASASPRRKQLLEQIGLQFKIVPSKLNEKLNPRLKPKHQAEFLSLQKAKDVGAKHKGALIIAADTMVVVKNEILGKPKSQDEAKRMLKKLSGTKHFVITGFTILDTNTQKAITKSVEITIYMRKLSRKEIDAFVKTKEPFDKAGGYGLQEKGAIFIEKIEGDFSGAVGLPLFSLVQELKKFDITLL